MGGFGGTLLFHEFSFGTRVRCSRHYPLASGCDLHLIGSRHPHFSAGWLPDPGRQSGVMIPFPPPPPRSGSSEQEHRVVKRYRYNAIRVGPGIKYTVYTTVLNLFPINRKEPFCQYKDVLSFRFGVLDRAGEPLRVISTVRFRALLSSCLAALELPSNRSCHLTPGGCVEFLRLQPTLPSFPAHTYYNRRHNFIVG